MGGGLPCDVQIGEDERSSRRLVDADRLRDLADKLNIGHLMWGSDYPHTEGTFPFSMERITKDFADVPEHETRKMVSENAATLYGISDA